MEQRRFCESKDIQALLQVGETTSYRILKKLNDELAAQGYLTIRAKVPRKYVMERFGITEEQKA